MPRALADGIDWVGYVDWTVRDFHSYETRRGSTYNAYLIRDDKTALIDTVKAPYVGVLLARVGELGDPAGIDYVVCNHAEPDHAGALPAVLAACPEAEVVCDAKCRQTLSEYHDTTGWRFRIVAGGDSISLGRRSLAFAETPMAHWPESMVTYVPEEKLLFSMDAFGQHVASSGRFDDEEPLDVLMDEARTYYANILMLYARPVVKALEAVAGLDVETIAPSHGVIWRKHLGEILAAYRRWSAMKPQAKVVVVYDTMWQATERMARAIADGAADGGAEVKLLHARAAHNTLIATEVLEAAAIAFGSATLNNTLMPSMASALTYLKGLKPHGKAGLAFGSFGWAPGAVKDLMAYMEAMRLDVLGEPITDRYAPSAEILERCRSAGRTLAARAKELASP